MTITFTKNTPTHQTFEIKRSDGSVETALLETRSFMPHDLIHFAYEMQVPCLHSFYGRLAQGTPLETFKEMNVMFSTNPSDAELITTERITGPLTTFLRGGLSNEDFIQALKNLFDALSEPLPTHITPSFLDDSKIRYNALFGQWSALPHHTPMQLHWPFD